MGRHDVCPGIHEHLHGVLTARKNNCVTYIHRTAGKYVRKCMKLYKTDSGHKYGNSTYIYIYISLFDILILFDKHTKTGQIH